MWNTAHSDRAFTLVGCQHDRAVQCDKDLWHDGSSGGIKPVLSVCGFHPL